MCSGCRLADCCDTTESVTNQLEKHQWDVPNVFLGQGWTGVQQAVPLGEELAGDWDACAAGFHSATGAWLELRAYKFQPSEEEAAGVCASVCIWILVSKSSNLRKQLCICFTSHWQCRLYNKLYTHTNKLDDTCTHLTGGYRGEEKKTWNVLWGCVNVCLKEKHSGDNIHSIFDELIWNYKLKMHRKWLNIYTQPIPQPLSWATCKHKLKLYWYISHYIHHWDLDNN